MPMPREQTTTVRLLDAWKLKKGISSDHEAWQVLKLSGQSAISNWRMRRSHAEPVIAAKMAREIGASVEYVLMSIEADRATRQATKSLWNSLALKAIHAFDKQKHGAAVLLLLLVLTPIDQVRAHALEPATSSPVAGCIMRSAARIWRWLRTAVRTVRGSSSTERQDDATALLA